MKRRIKSYIIFIVYLTECTSQSFLGSFFGMVTGANRAARLSRAQKSPVETFEAHAPTIS